MFQLFKERNFSALINDTFSFFKATGKNYFKNYLILNGGLLLVLIVLCFVMGRIFFENLFSSMSSGGSQQIIDDYFADNVGFFITAGIITGIIILLITIINYAYPVIYLSLFEKHEKPDAKQIFAVLKSKIGRIFLFGLLSMVTFVPMAFILGAFSVLLIVIVIGIPVVLILFAAFSCWIYLSFFDYLNTNNGYFTSMGNGWKMLFQNFWNHMGSTAIFYLIVYTVQGVLAMIPYVIGIASIIVNTNISPEERADNFSIMSIIMLVMFMIYIVLAYLLGNVIMIGHGMVYYSCREHIENKSMYNEIDLIGTDFE